MRKKVCMIYTGGTIGMVPTESGFAPKKGYFAGELAKIADLKDPSMPEFDLIEYDPLLDSSNITFEQWNQMASTIKEHYDEYDGFVILHGTDTMAYSASALSFMLENLDKPVIFTGSQIPMCNLRSDGKDNIITSLLIAASGRVHEVALFFGHSLIRGNRAMKMSSDGLIAFESPNYPPLATVGIDIEYHESRLLPHPKGRFRVHFIKPVRMAVIKLFPGIQFDLFAPIVSENIDALILETFGTGNIPNYANSLPPLIEKAIENGTSVIVCTQCPQGTVRLGAYEVSSSLEKAGAASGYNMTTEAAVAKICYLVSRGIERHLIASYMEDDLRGELDH